MSLANDPPYSLEQVAGMLVAESVIEVETDRAESVEVWTISHEGDRVSASAPRLAVAAGMRVSCRLVTEPLPLMVTAEIEQAEFRSQTRASLVLRVLSAASDGYQRTAERIPLSAPGTLRALICDRLVPDEVIPIQLADISAGGFAATTADARPRGGDRCWFSDRFLEVEVACEVRNGRAAAGPGELHTIGCYFIQPDVVGPVLSRVMSRLARP
ncbi:MAG: hypothetical protein ACXVYV_01190 [Gaiellales bacterium]